MAYSELYIKSRVLHLVLNESLQNFQVFEFKELAFSIVLIPAEKKLLLDKN